MYAAHLRAVRAFLLVRGCPRGRLDDSAQEVFLRAWRSRQSFNGQCRFTTFVMGIARNVLRESHRQNRLNTQELTADLPASPSTSAEALDAPAELIGRMREHLNSQQWQAVELTCLLDLTPAQAADRVGCRPSIFYNRLARARKKLAELLNEYRGRRPEG